MRRSGFDSTRDVAIEHARQDASGGWLKIIERENAMEVARTIPIGALIGHLARRRTRCRHPRHLSDSDPSIVSIHKRLEGDLSKHVRA